MIDVQTLMIGNLIKARQNETLTFERFVPDYDSPDSGVIFSKKASIGYFVKECEPIEITEEWLLRLGFEHSLYYEDSLYRISYGRFDLMLSFFGPNELTPDRDYLVYVNHDFLGDYQIDKGNQIEYVHQLQNLFFILSGTELQLTPLPRTT